MSALDVRSNSAVMKRAEQLKRWEESDTNRSPASPRPEHGRKIKFSSGCVFLAACLSSDKEEVLKLLENGADINTANVDGLTALHQACIDDNLDMVEFLVEHGADINRQDNEGWTPLHATASCGFVSIARFLVENGADVAAVNSDGDLALDLAIDIQNMGMIEYMQQVINEHKVDCEKARQAEEQLMLADAKKWLRSDASEVDRPHAKTGATALHVAAAKGYTKVISLLLAGRANVDKQDNDGWTPLHAAAHWGQKEAAEMLVDAMADMEIRNYAGQTCMEVADRKMIKTLEELRAKSKRSIKRRPSSQIRISDATEHHIENLAPKIFRTELKNNLNNEENKKSTVTVSPTTTTTTTTTNINEQKQEQLPAKVTTTETCNISGTKAIITTTTTTSPDVIEATFTIPKSAMNIPPPVAAINSNAMVVENEDAPWRRNNIVQRVRLMDTITNKDASENSDVVLRRSQSFDKDKKKPFMPQRTALSLALNSASVANATVTIPATNTTATTLTTTTTSTTTTTTTTSTQSGTTTTPQRRSFAPPARNEESETQRKAHAKRVRESRRSTQGVTLDEIKSAEELVKKSNSTTTTATTTTNNLSTTTTTTATTTTATATIKKEDTSSVEATFTPTNNSKIILSAPAVIVAAQRNSLERPKNANVDSSSVTDPSAYVSKRFSNSIAATNIAEQDKDNDKENDNRTTLTTQAVLQRRRKPKRRSTGVVHIDMDDLDPERSDGTNDAEEKDDEVKSDEGMIDYKALWEAEKLEKEKLKQQVDKKDEELVQLRATIERNASAANAKNSISELEKRERRAMERKLSEMEEELKQLELYKTENQRLKEENGALIRVISKLSK